MILARRIRLDTSTPVKVGAPMCKQTQYASPSRSRRVEVRFFMNSNENWIVGSALLGLSLVLGATAAAMEPDKNGVFAQSSPSHSLPVFFDGARLPSLHDMWKRRDGAPTAVPQPGNTTLGQDLSVNDAETQSAANAAAEPAEEVGRPVATVRERAEELSQRFGGGATAATPAEGDVSEITTSALPDRSAPAQGERAATVAPKPANESETAAAVGVKAALPSPKVKPSPKGKRAAIPPIPLRAPPIAQVRKPLLPPTSRVGAVPRSGPSAGPVKKPASPQHTIPTQLQSFGWNAQVRSP